MDSTNRLISRYPPLCPQRYSVPSVAKASEILKSVATACARIWRFMLLTRQVRAVRLQASSIRLYSRFNRH